MALDTFDDFQEEIPADEKEKSLLPFDVFKQEVFRLLKARIELETIVKLLGAENFYYLIPQAQASWIGRFDIQGFLDQEKKRYENISLSLPHSYHIVHEVILPPDEGEVKVGSGKGIEEKKIIPRSKFLMMLLASLHIPYNIIEGENNAQMMRTRSYYIFILPSLEKLLFVNNEEGNATFIIHGFNPTKERVEDFMRMKKSELKALIPERVSYIEYPGDENKWKEIIAIHLQSVGSLSKKETMPVSQTSSSNSEVNFLSSMDLKNKGWMSGKQLAEKLDISRTTLKKILEPLREIHPKFFCLFPHVELYAPDLIQLLFKMLENKEKAPPDWLTLDRLYATIAPLFRSHGLVISIERIKNLITDYKKSHPRLIRAYRSVRRLQDVDHFDPLLAKKIIKRLYLQNIKEMPPLGWMHQANILQIFKIYPPKLQEILLPYRETHPHWFKEYLSPSSGKFTEYYDPELIEAVKNICFSVEIPPPEWVNISTAISILGISQTSFVRYALRYRTSHSYYFGIFKDRRGAITEHFSPELIDQIGKDLEPKRRK